MELVFYYISLLVLFVTVLIVYKFRNDGQAIIKIILASIFIIVSMLIFPAYYKGYGDPVGGDWFSSIVFTILYSLKALAGRQPLDITYMFLQDYEYYKWIMYGLFILAPIVTAGFIISLFGDFVEKIRCKLLKKETVHIFSELNEESILMAESIGKDNNGFIFCNFKDKISELDKTTRRRIKDIKGIVLHIPEGDVKLSSKVELIKYYEISHNRENNAAQALKLIDQYMDYKEKSIDLYVFASGGTTEIMFDSIDKGVVRVHLIDEIKYTCYSLLFDSPLFSNLKDRKKISVMVIGAGETGKEIIKAVSWCSKMASSECELNVVDINANQVKSELLRDYPELYMDTIVRFFSINVNDAEFNNVLDSFCDETTYVVIALKEDELNINTAMYLRKYYIAKNINNEIPLIHFRVRDAVKNDRVTKMKENSLLENNINAFGSMKNVFSNNNLSNSKLEEMAKRVHLSYWNVLDGTDREKEEALKSYYKSEYSQRSSFATALHIIYKLYDCGISLKSGNDLCSDYSSMMQSILQNKDIQDKLAEVEHKRWNAFMRTEGFTCSEMTSVEAYYEDVNHYIHPIAKLHPAIVSWDLLDEISEQLSNITKDQIDLKKSDYDIINNIPNIIG